MSRFLDLIARTAIQHWREFTPRSPLISSARNGRSFILRHPWVKSFSHTGSHPGAGCVNAYCLDTPIAPDVAQFDGRDWEGARRALD